MSLDFLPAELENIIINYKEDMEHLEIMETRQKFKKTLDDIKEMTISTYIHPGNKFSILYHRRGNIYPTGLMDLEDKKYINEYNTEKDTEDFEGHDCVVYIDYDLDYYEELKYVPLKKIDQPNYFSNFCSWFGF